MADKRKAPVTSWGNEPGTRYASLIIDIFIVAQNDRRRQLLTGGVL